MIPNDTISTGTPSDMWTRKPS